MKINGLDQLQKNLEKIQESENVTMGELMSDDFMSTYTKFSTLQEMFEASGFVINSLDDFAAIPDDKWDDFVGANSDFGNWVEMLSSANIYRATRKLGLQ